MSSRFLGTQNATGITDGTLNVKGATLAGENLVVGKPVRTNAAKQIISTDLLISDVQGLQTALSNPSFVDVSLSGDIIPQTDNISDVGQSAKRFKNGYFTSLTPNTINGPVSISGGDLNMQIRRITNLATPTLTSDATTKIYVDTADNSKLSLTGGTLSGQLQCQDIIPSVNAVSALGTSLRKFADVRSTNATLDTTTMTFGTVTSAPSVGTDITNKTYVDTQRDTCLAKTGGTMTGSITSLRTTDTNIILGGGAASTGSNSVTIGGVANNNTGVNNVTIGQAASAGIGSASNVVIGNNAVATGTSFACVVVGKDSGAGISSVNNVTLVGATACVTGGTSGSTYIGCRAGNTAGGFTGVTIVNGSETALNPTANNQIRIAAGNATFIDAVPTELKFASGGVTAKSSWMESWWAHNALQSTAMTTNTATTSLRLNTATSFYFSPSLATAGINSLIPVVVNNSPIFAYNGPAFPTEWAQSTAAIAANPAGPSTTGGNRVQFTYGGSAARRFSVTVTGTYQTTTANQLIAFQGIVKFASATFTFVNGTASSWFETDNNRTFIAVSKKILLVNPGDVFEIAVGYDPLNAPNQLNSIIARDMTVAFTAMLNST